MFFVKSLLFLSPDAYFTGGRVGLPNFNHRRDSLLQVLDMGDDAHMLAAGCVELLQGRHYAVEPLLAEGAEPLVDKDGVHADAVFRKARKAERE